MKKLVLGVSFLGLLASCNKIQPGSNHGVLRMEGGTERWSDDHKADNQSVAKDTAAATAQTPVAGDSTSAAKSIQNALDAKVKSKPNTDTSPQHAL